MPSPAPIWRTRALAAASLAAWALGFHLVARTGTWAPLAVLGPLLAAVALAVQPRARALLRPDRRLVALGLAGALAMSAATYALFALAVALWPPLHGLVAGLYRVLTAPRFTPLERALLIPLVATAEEIVFRGEVLPTAGAPAPFPGAPDLPAMLAGRALLVRPGRRELRCVIGVGLLVAAAHFPSGSLLLALIAFACGTAWGLLRVCSGSLVPGMISHVLWDLAILVAWPLI